MMKSLSNSRPTKVLNLILVLVWVLAGLSIPVSHYLEVFYEQKKL